VGRCRRILWLCCGVALVAAVATTGGGWWYRTTRPDYRLREGQAALQRGDADLAEHFARLLEASSSKDEAHLLRGEAHFRQAKPFLDSNQTEAAFLPLRRALAEFNKIQDQGARRVDAAALSGQCLLALNEPLQAERAFLFVLDHQPEQVEAHRGLATVYYEQGALSKAIRHAREVGRLDARDGRPNRLLGHIYLHLDRHDDAADAFQEALRRDLSNEFAEDSRERLAECLVKQNAYSEALQVLEACSPDQSGARHVSALRVQCLMRDQPGKAHKLLDQALATDPESAELLALRARVSWEGHDAGSAAPLLERALKIDPHDYPARYLLVQVYQALDRTAEADEQRRRAEQTKELLKELGERFEEADGKPWDAGVRRRLAELCAALGRTEEAERWRTAARACGAE
jgi:tetratricopeptide (TPR) repeat protein